MNKNTDPRARAAERALLDMRELRAVWATYKDARRAMQSTNPAVAQRATREALLAEQRLGELLAPEPAVLSTFDADIPGRPGWPIEYEDLNAG